MNGALRYCDLSTWTPAFAGEVHVIHPPSKLSLG